MLYKHQNCRVSLRALNASCLVGRRSEGLNLSVVFFVAGGFVIRPVRAIGFIQPTGDCMIRGSGVVGVFSDICVGRWHGRSGCSGVLRTRDIDPFALKDALDIGKDLNDGIVLIERE